MAAQAAPQIPLRYSDPHVCAERCFCAAQAAPQIPYSKILAFALNDAIVFQLARSAKWTKMLGSWRRYTDCKTSKVKRRVRKGIPDSMRRSAWNAMTNMPR